MDAGFKGRSGLHDPGAMPLTREFSEAAITVDRKLMVRHHPGRSQGSH